MRTAVTCRCARALGACRVDLGLDLVFSHRRELERLESLERGKELADGLLTQRFSKDLLQRGFVQEARGLDLLGSFKPGSFTVSSVMVQILGSSGCGLARRFQCARSMKASKDSKSGFRVSMGGSLTSHTTLASYNARKKSI